MKRECIAYLAGLIEGEGYVKSYEFPRLTKKGTPCMHRGIAIAVAMTDKDVMNNYGSLLGEFLGSNVKLRGPIKNGKSPLPLYEVRIYSDKAYAVMAAIYPFMGKRRQAAIEKSFLIYKELRIRKHKLDHTM